MRRWVLQGSSKLIDREREEVKEVNKVNTRAQKSLLVDLAIKQSLLGNKSDGGLGGSVGAG